MSEVKKNTEWLKAEIKGYAYANYGNRMKIDISEDELDSLIDQLDEPVIPKEIGERIEREINRYSLYQSLNYAYNYEGIGEDERRIDEWVIENTEEYAQAWLDGFTVEE